MAFSFTSESFHVVAARQSGAPAETDVVRLTPFDLSSSDQAGSARIAAAVKDPVNTAFDTRRGRLLLLDNADRLLEVRADANGDLDPKTLVRRDALRLDLRDAQGMTVDPQSGVVFILDAGAPAIVRVEPAADGSFDTAATSVIDLGPTGVSAVRGLAFDPSTGHLDIGAAQGLVEVTSAGEVVTTRDLSGLGLGKPEGMVFAPSGDLTDASSEVSVYVADSGGARSSGQIVELSLTSLAATESTDFTSTLVGTVDMGALSPPSTDPSGITYVPTTDRLLITDGEVEEVVNGITHFQGANVWELNRNGLTLNRTANISSVPPTVVPVTNEPAGAAFNPTNGHYYISADDGKKVFDVNPGADGLLGTAGDTVTPFDTLAYGNSDPEGVTYDTFGGHLFVADGLNREVYEYTTSGTFINHFDTAQYGVQDPESVEFNPDSGTLFVLSDRLNTAPPVPIIIETTTGGTLIRTIDASASGAYKPAGLAYAPASDGSGAKHFYIVDRGIDNNADPNAVDGKLHEITAPTPGSPANTPPVVNAGSDQALALPASANLDGTVSDDNLPAPPSLTTTWTQVSGPSTVTFGNANAVDTTASVPVSGIYVVRLTANDGQFSAFDDVTLTFSGGGSVQSVDVRINLASDDAEEISGGTVQRGDGDLDMMTDTTGTGSPKVVVGTRFTGITIPPGASISSAYVQFQADEADSVATNLTIKGQDAVNPPTFSTTAFDISLRPTTTASASWSPAAWVGVGDAGLAQRTSNLSGIIQEIVSKTGWASGNAVVLLVTGSGERVAVAHNQIPAAAALLHVEYTTGGGGNSPPQITSSGGGATAAVSAAENQTAVTDVDASDPNAGDTLTYSKAGGADAASFAIDPSSGVLTFVSAPNFEAPSDAGANNVYDVTVQVSDGNGGSDSQAIAVTVANANEFSPVITSDGGNATAALSKPENSTAVTDVNATDADLQTPTYAISGGADYAAFTIVPATGVLTFVSAPDFEIPTDVGLNNTYEVVVEASDGSLSDTQAITVTVTDVAEGTNNPPTITSNGGGATASVSAAENQTAVTDVNATDPDAGDTLTYSISGSSADFPAFLIVPTTGVLTFMSAPNYELPTDFDLNGVYEVTVQVSDGKGGFDTQALSVTVTDVVESAGAPLYFSLVDLATVGGVAAENEDVVYFDGSTFSLAFDGSDVGLAAFRIDAFSWVSATSLLLSFDAPGTVPGIAGTTDDSDLVLFSASSLGTTTAGTFSLYFDGSDVGLTTNAEDVDAVELLAGHILLSTSGAVSVTGVTGEDKDLLDFAPTTLGATTDGTYSFYFDGSDVELTTSAEDIDATAVDGNGKIYLSTVGNFAVTGVSGADEDVFVFTPTSTGSTTAGFYSSTLYFDGSLYGLAANDVFAIDLP